MENDKRQFGLRDQALPLPIIYCSLSLLNKNK